MKILLTWMTGITRNKSETSNFSCMVVILNLSLLSNYIQKQTLQKSITLNQHSIWHTGIISAEYTVLQKYIPQYTQLFWQADIARILFLQTFNKQGLKLPIKCTVPDFFQILEINEMTSSCTQFIKWPSYICPNQSQSNDDHFYSCWVARHSLQMLCNATKHITQLHSNHQSHNFFLFTVYDSQSKCRFPTECSKTF